MSKLVVKQDRTIVYVDGFNLYFGLKASLWRKYYWLDLFEFCKFLAQKRQFIAAKYYTARISGPSGKQQRQQAFLHANETRNPALEITYGKYLSKPVQCSQCSHIHQRREEKMTDVNIATHLLNDAWKDRFDVAILVSGDSDLVPPVQVVRQEFPAKRILVAFPPNRFSHDLKSHANNQFHISEQAFQKCQMPDQVLKPDGTFLTRPASWT